MSSGLAQQGDEEDLYKLALELQRVTLSPSVYRSRVHLHLQNTTNSILPLHILVADSANWQCIAGHVTRMALNKHPYTNRPDSAMSFFLTCPHNIWGMLEGLGLGAQGLGFRIWGLGLRAWDLGCSV